MSNLPQEKKWSDLTEHQSKYLLDKSWRTLKRRQQKEKEKHIRKQWTSWLKVCHLGLNTEWKRAGICKREKVEVQLGPIRAGPHVFVGGEWDGVANRGGRREQRGQRGGSAESDGPRPCEALLGLSSALLTRAANTPSATPAALPHLPPPRPPLPSGTARAEQYKTIRRKKTGLDHPDPHIHTHTDTHNGYQEEAPAWEVQLETERDVHEHTHMH